MSHVQVFQLGQRLKLDALVTSALEALVVRPWTGADLSMLLTVLKDQTWEQLHRVLHHPDASAIAEIQACNLCLCKCGAELCLCCKS